MLVTGHTGFKGSWLALWLTRLGAEVTGYSDDVPTEPSHFEALGLDIADLRGDVADADAVKRAVAAARPEIVFHLAAQSLVRRSYADPIATYRTNLIGSLALFEACRSLGGFACNVSATTDKVYRNSNGTWPIARRTSSAAPDPYSASNPRRDDDPFLPRDFVRDGSMLIASVRAGNVIGGGDWAQDRLIPDIVRAAGKGGPCASAIRIRTRPGRRPRPALRLSGDRRPPARRRRRRR